jgi:serine/threonine-protein phosphatase 2A regulatory subunit B'
MAEQAILSCLKYWPKVDPHKEVSTLAELESILNLLRSIEPLIEIRFHLLKRLGESISSIHSGVAERALILVHCPVLLCLIKQYKAELLPLLINGIISNVHRNELEYLQLLW